MSGRDFAAPSVVEDLREQIGRMDRRLVRLLAERERLQWQLLAYKQALGMPLVDAEQEARVRQRARLAALRSSSDPHLAEAVIVQAIRSGMSRYSDRWVTGPAGIRPHTDPTRVPAACAAPSAWVTSP